MCILFVDVSYVWRSFLGSFELFLLFCNLLSNIPIVLSDYIVYFIQVSLDQKFKIGMLH